MYFFFLNQCALIPDGGAALQVGALAERLRDPQKGVSVQDRRYFFRTYPKTFVGMPQAPTTFVKWSDS